MPDNLNVPGMNPPEQSAPASAPMSTPAQAKGNQQAARANVGIAMNMLENALPHLGDEDKGEVLKTLTSLHRRFGKSSDDEIMPAQLQALYRQTSGGMPPGLQPGANPPPTPGGIPPGL